MFCIAIGRNVAQFIFVFIWNFALTLQARAVTSRLSGRILSHTKLSSVLSNTQTKTPNDTTYAKDF